MVDAVALLNAAKRLLLAATVGGNPKKVKTGTTIIPPPSPIIDPKIPAANPNRTIHNCSIMIIKNHMEILYITSCVNS